MATMHGLSFVRWMSTYPSSNVLRNSLLEDTCIEGRTNITTCTNGLTEVVCWHKPSLHDMASFNICQAYKARCTVGAQHKEELRKTRATSTMIAVPTYVCPTCVRTFYAWIGLMDENHDGFYWHEKKHIWK